MENLEANTNLKVYILKPIEYDKDGNVKANEIYQKFFTSATSSIKSTFISNKEQDAKINNTNVKMELFCQPESSEKKDKKGFVKVNIDSSAKDKKVILGDEISNNDIAYINVNEEYFNLRTCPLIDYTKPHFIFREDGVYKSGIPDVTSCQVNLSTKNQSSCNISIINADFKYNLGKDVRDYRNYMKCAFDTWDIVIVRAEKRKQAKEFTSSLNTAFSKSIEDYKNPVTYFKDPYAEVDKDGNTIDDPMCTIFTGYICNVNNSFDYNTGMPMINLVCSGPSKKMEWIRIVTGQASAPLDASAAIIPLSAYSFPQTISADNKPTLKNEDVVKNVVQRTMCGIDNNKEVFDAKKNFYIKFNENITESSGGSIWKEINENRDKYQTQSVSMIDDYVTTYPTKDTEKQYEEYLKTSSQTEAQLTKSELKYYGINIYKNAFMKNNVMPIFLINGTSQPAYQMSFNNFSNIWNSNFSTVYQFINEIANRLQFNFYDDPYGTIRFEVIDMTLEHLHSNGSPFNLDFVLSYNETQDINAYSSILPVHGAPLYASLGDSYEKVGLSAVYRDDRLTKKYGEKMMNPLNVINYTDKKALSKYAKNYLDLMNRKVERNYSFTMIGNPEIFQGKCAYFPELLKLFYVESVSHNWTAGGTFTTTISGGYPREILGRIDEIVNNSTEIFLGRKIKGYSDYALFNTAKKKINLELQKSDLKAIRNYLDGAFLKNIKKGNAQSNVLISLRDNLGVNIGTDNSAIRKEILQKYDYKNLVENYLDGYFWDLPIEVYPYETCLSIQEENKAQLVKRQKAKEVKQKQQKLNEVKNNG